MFKFYFKKFNFREFKDFIFDLVDRYGFFEIRFHPDRKELFSRFQLSHADPSRNLKSSNGFIWAWMQKRNEVRKVNFDFWRRDKKAEISMTIDLDDKSIVLTGIKGIVSTVEVEEVLKDNFSSLKFKKFNVRTIKEFLLTNLHKIIVGVFIGVTVGFILLMLGWN